MKNDVAEIGGVYLLIGFAVLGIYFAYNNFGDPAAGLALGELFLGMTIVEACSKLKR